MASIQSIKDRYGRELCRTCINHEYRVRLEREDCEYNRPFPYACPCCGKVQNLVTGLRLSGKLKMMGKKNRKR